MQLKLKMIGKSSGIPLAMVMIFTMAGLGTLTPAKTALAYESAPSDPQEADIIKTLKASGAAFGWDSSYCWTHNFQSHPDDEVRTTTYCPEVWGPRLMVESSSIDGPTVYTQGAGYGFQFVPPAPNDCLPAEYGPFRILAYPTEADAKADMKEVLAMANLSEYSKQIEIHGYKAIITFSKVIDWQVGRFLFSASEVYDSRIISVEELAETLYINASKHGLIIGEGGAIPAQDSDGDGVADDIDQCPGTPAGVAVDASGCEEMSLTVSTDKKAYTPGETVTIQGRVTDSAGGVSSAAVVVNVSGSTLSTTADGSGSYRVEFPIPADAAPSTFNVTVTATGSTEGSATASTTFTVGQVMSVEIVTDKDHYLIGDTVYSTITVKDSQGTLVSGAELQITTIRSDSGRTTELSGFTDTLGENQWNFTWGQDDSGKTIAEGKLKINVTAVKDGANGQASITICGCGDLEKTEVEDCLDCPEDSPCEPEEVCDPSSTYKDPETMCSPKVAYIFISKGLGWYAEWWASDDIAGIRKLYASLGYTVPPNIYVDHITDIAPYLSRPSTKAIAYAGHGEEPGGMPTIEAAAATSGGYSVKAAIAETGKGDKGFLGVCQFGPYASKWVDSKDKLEKILADRVEHPNLDYVYMFSCYSLDNMSMRDYLLRSGGTYWGYKGKLPGNGTLTKTLKP